MWFQNQRAKVGLDIVAGNRVHFQDFISFGELRHVVCFYLILEHNIKFTISQPSVSKLKKGCQPVNRYSCLVPPRVSALSLAQEVST